MEIKPIILDKLHLCLYEIGMCRCLLKTKQLDDFCSRLISIYIMMRADDITKMWSKSIGKNEIERILSDDVKNNRYNRGFRAVRDKLGAHYQSTSEDSVDIFGSSSLFRGFDNSDVTSFVDELFAAESLIEDAEIKYDSFEIVSDLTLALKVFEELYSDDKGCITIGAVDLFGVNKGFMISGSDAQRKAQFIRGIELMVETAFKLANQPYEDDNLQRMFKRLLVCMIYNYHDNLYTRTELNTEVVQYEEGFDRFYKSLLNAEDEQIRMDVIFEKYEEIYHTRDYFKKNRGVRDKACGHFDLNSDISEINSLLDNIDILEIYSKYQQMLNLFNYICNNVSLMKFVALPPRSYLPNSNFESIEGVKSFYGDDNNCKVPETMTPKEILRSIRKRDAQYDYALYLMREILSSNDKTSFNAMIEAIRGRLVEMTKFETDLHDILIGLRDAKRGFPDRLQDSVVSLLLDKQIIQSIKLGLVWVFSQIANKSKGYDVRAFIQSLIKNSYYPVKCLGFISYLHYLMSDRSPFIKSSNEPKNVDSDFRECLLKLDKPVNALGIWLALNQCWTFNPDYSNERKKETIYDAFLKNGLQSGIENYIKYAGITDSDDLRVIDTCVKTLHYLVLLQIFTLYEKNRNQKPNAFMELWNCNCFIWVRSDVYESLAVGAMTEMNGDIETAERIFTETHLDNPINKEAKQVLSEFRERHDRC